MRPLRVAYLPASLRPAGAERQMLTLAERLPRDRFEAEFVVIGEPGEYGERAAASGIPVRSLGPVTWDDNPVERALHRAGKVARYVRLIRAGKYDIVDAWLYPADVLAALTRPLTDVPLVVAGRRNVDPQRAFGQFEGRVAALVRSMTDAVIANSAAAAEHAVRVQHVEPAKVRIIRNGVAFADEVTDGQRAALRSELGARDDEVVVAAIANYRDVKRLDLLVAAFAEVARGDVPVRLELVGEGPLLGALAAQVHELGIDACVCLHGSVLDPEPLYPAFDVVVQSSEREGLPNALLEAAAAGRAIVATDAGGSAEIVLDGETGLLVPIHDVPALTSALRRVVEDRALRERLGVAARAHARNAFGIDRFVAEFAAVYESLAEARHIRR